MTGQESLRTPDLQAPERPDGGLDRIECGGCGRWFITLDGPGMLAAIKGPCPDCGGSFRLARPRALAEAAGQRGSGQDGGTAVLEDRAGHT